MAQTEIWNCQKNTNGETCMQENLFEHFRHTDYLDFLSDVLITLIDKGDKSNHLKFENL